MYSHLGGEKGIGIDINTIDAAQKSNGRQDKK